MFQVLVPRFRRSARIAAAAIISSGLALAGGGCESAGGRTATGPNAGTYMHPSAQPVLVNMAPAPNGQPSYAPAQQPQALMQPAPAAPQQAYAPPPAQPVAPAQYWAAYQPLQMQQVASNADWRSDMINALQGVKKDTGALREAGNFLTKAGGMAAGMLMGGDDLRNTAFTGAASIIGVDGIDSMLNASERSDVDRAIGEVAQAAAAQGSWAIKESSVHGHRIGAYMKPGSNGRPECWVGIYNDRTGSRGNVGNSFKLDEFKMW